MFHNVEQWGGGGGDGSVRLSGSSSDMFSQGVGTRADGGGSGFLMLNSAGGGGTTHGVQSTSVCMSEVAGIAAAEAESLEAGLVDACTDDDLGSTCLVSIGRCGCKQSAAGAASGQCRTHSSSAEECKSVAPRPIKRQPTNATGCIAHC